MAISEIPGGPKPITPARDDRSRETARPRAANQDGGDHVRLSPEARSMYAASREGRLEEIREKVRTGFYDRADVTEKVVDEILKDLKGER